MSWNHIGHYGANTMFSTRLDYWVDEETGQFAYGGGYLNIEQDAIPANATVEPLPEGGIDELVASKGIELD